MLFGDDVGGGTVAGIITAFVGAFGGLGALVSWIVREMFKESKAQREAAAAEADRARELYREQMREERQACDRRAAEQLEEWTRLHAETMGALAAQGRIRDEAMAMLRAIYQVLVRETKLSKVVEASDDAIWTKNTDGIITSWNRAAHNLLGWHPGEVIGQSVYRLLPPDEHDEERDMLARLKRGERVERYQTTRIHRDGRLIRLEVSISPVRDATGQVISIGTIAREVP